MSSIFELFGSIVLDTSWAEKALAKVSKAGQKVGGVLSKGFKLAGQAALQMGKVIGTGVAAGTAAMGKLVSSAMSAHASYEQLEGGVKKLFGDDAQNLVMEYARNAYRTAGLSANEYMDTVTSFSASLISSLGKDTVAAAAYADLAITDMADNANTFGTAMEDLQNAYQGFAKQNYTMLDNLKLGYGGTKEEMQRLISDAHAVNGAVDESSLSFDNIVLAIHTMQEQMQIAGTTSREAATTIEGSCNMAKAAWENWVTELSKDDADMGKLTEELLQSVETAASNVVPRVATIVGTALSQLPSLVTSVGPVLGQAFVDIFTQALGSAAEAVPGPMGDILSAVSDGVGEIGVARAPIRLLERQSHGRRDLGVQVAGGGIVDGYEAAVPFDGRRYARNPTVAPSVRIEDAPGETLIRADEQGRPLAPAPDKP